jgi:hypothetical protein
MGMRIEMLKKLPYGPMIVERYVALKPGSRLPSERRKMPVMTQENGGTVCGGQRGGTERVWRRSKII